jgi:superfamily II DNA or RNA helicase
MIVVHEELPDEPRVVVQRTDWFGQPSFVLASLPRRAYPPGTKAPPLLAGAVNARRTRERPTGVTIAVAHTGPWLATTSKAQQTLLAWLLLAEDPQRRLEVSAVEPLKHQRTLIEHVLATPDLQRVLIGDEVGLGKTIEAALIVQRLRETNPALRILYLAPARLVSNVVREWRHLGMEARRFTSSDSDARPGSDSIVAASLQKAVREHNRQKLLEVPWDVIIADECHHLSDYGAGSTTLAFRLVRDLVAKQSPTGRLVLMSGTPHQGNPVRFRNLLSLLRRDGEDESALAGRVIFRIKENVTDWDGHPLFPLREVRSATVVSLGAAWGSFYNDVATLYETTDSGSRAGGWAKSQALQWVASSMKAGVAYLARLSMRRLGWTLDNPSLVAALTALTPYGRGGRNYDTLTAVYALFKELAPTQLDQDEEDDDIEDQSQSWQPDPVRLADLLSRGAALIRARSDDAKWEAMRQILREAGSEKVVLFCQPVETVSVVAEVIERSFAVKPAIIVGGQDDAEREGQIDCFLDPGGAQFLVSSRAGGEGINLQAARRLIHLDVPWNPMDMEQRVGRIHRFGSRQRILVDTLVVGGTREERAYAIARSKLHIITRELSLSLDEAEQLFARVMNLVPPDSLQEAFNDLPDDGEAGENETAIGQLVSEGYKRWEEFTREYSQSAILMEEAKRGSASWLDVQDFLKRVFGAEMGAQASGTVFRFRDGDSIAESVATATTRVHGKTWVCDNVGGLPVRDSGGALLPRIGLNTPEVASALLNCLRAGPVAGAVRLPPANLALAQLAAITSREGSAVIIFVSQHLQRDGEEVREDRLELHVTLIGSDGKARDAIGHELAFIRFLLSATRVERPGPPPPGLVLLETAFWQALVTAGVKDEGARFAAVWPVACFLVAPAS